MVEQIGIYIATPFKILSEITNKTLPGIFLENILKYQNDHSDKFGGAILAQ